MKLGAFGLYDKASMEQVPIETDIAPIEELHGPCHPHRLTADKDGWADVMGQDEDQTPGILQPVTQKGSKKDNNIFVVGGEKIPLLFEVALWLQQEKNKSEAQSAQPIWCFLLLNGQ